MICEMAMYTGDVYATYVKEGESQRRELAFCGCRPQHAVAAPNWLSWMQAAICGCCSRLFGSRTHTP
jgi:hypothetical protein